MEMGAMHEMGAMPVADKMKHRRGGKGMREARTALGDAIKLHEGHMDGSIPTSDASQAQLMRLIQRASRAIGGPSGESPSHELAEKKEKM